jgi:hypothetical protein
MQEKVKTVNFDKRKHRSRDSAYKSVDVRAKQRFSYQRRPLNLGGLSDDYLPAYNLNR